MKTKKASFTIQEKTQGDSVVVRLMAEFCGLTWESETTKSPNSFRSPLPAAYLGRDKDVIKKLKNLSRLL